MINTVEKNYDLLDVSYFNFKVTNQDGTIMFVTNDPANTDYQAIMEYIENGGVVIDNGGGE